MIKMLVIADDFTGALDTGVQFTRQGLHTKISTNINFNYSSVDDDLDILVIDAETRHLSPKIAYGIIKEITHKAISNKVKFIYKKTDSALRGNIGSELSGLLDGSGEKALYFVPAFPLQNRITENFIHYIDGVPVAESVFGKDPFEPVVTSNVFEIIKLQTQKKCVGIENYEDLKGSLEGIIVLNAVEDKDLENVAQIMHEKSDFRIFAGCAGFASVLSKYLEINKTALKKIKFDNGLLVACGSVNPISLRQIETGVQNDFDYITLTKEQKINSNWFNENKNQYKKIIENFSCNKFLIVDANDIDNKNKIEPCDFANINNVSLEEIRTNISSFISQIITDFLTLKPKKNIMIIGGDTIYAFINKLNIEVLEPIEEIFPGVVVSVIEHKGIKYNIISKSGGFGDSNLILDLKKFIEKN